MRFKAILQASILLGLAGCSAGADVSLAEAEVPKFHQMLDSGQSSQIYSTSSEDLKGVATQSDFRALLDAVHRKLGPTRSSEKRSWNINFHTSGEFVTLVYETQYAQGNATEQFVYRIQANQALLAGYHVNSNALITN
jgi:hypothetical protein